MAHYCCHQLVASDLEVARLAHAVAVLGHLKEHNDFRIA